MTSARAGKDVAASAFPTAGGDGRHAGAGLCACVVGAARLAAALVAFPSAASADLLLCNRTSYVVDAAICNACNECISPCPTGAIDNWRQVERAKPYTLAEQLGWDTLPPQGEIPAAANAADSEVPAEVVEIPQVRMNRFMSPFLPANGPRTAGISRFGCCGVVFSFPVRLTDGMDRREVQNVEAHLGDLRQQSGAVS